MTSDERVSLKRLVDSARRVAEGVAPAAQFKPRTRAYRRTRAGRSYCVYCGGRIRDAHGHYTLGLTCKNHLDLPSLDWRYGGTTGEPVSHIERAAA